VTTKYRVQIYTQNIKFIALADYRISAKLCAHLSNCR